MEDFIEHIMAPHNLSHHHHLNAWRIDLPGRGNLVCQLSVAPGALEWYANVNRRENGEEVWTDWLDYVGFHDGKTRDQLEDDIQRDQSTFIAAWLYATDARITRAKTKFFFGHFSFTLKNLELCIGGQWMDAPMYDPSR
jgi:hypothetical protein